MGQGAVAAGLPEGQQPAPLALRNQLETVVGDLHIAYARLGQIPGYAMDPSAFTSLQNQYATLMDIGGQLAGRLDNLGPALGEDLGLSKEINRLQEDVEAFVGAVESAIMQMTTANGAGDKSNGDGAPPPNSGLAPIPGGALPPVPPPSGQAALASSTPWLRWGLVVGSLLLVAGGGYWWYQRRPGVTPAL